MDNKPSNEMKLGEPSELKEETVLKDSGGFAKLCETFEPFEKKTAAQRRKKQRQKERKRLKKILADDPSNSWAVNQLNRLDEEAAEKRKKEEEKFHMSKKQIEIMRYHVREGRPPGRRTKKKISRNLED